MEPWRFELEGRTQDLRAAQRWANPTGLLIVTDAGRWFLYASGEDVLHAEPATVFAWARDRIDLLNGLTRVDDPACEAIRLTGTATRGGGAYIFPEPGTALASGGASLNQQEAIDIADRAAADSDYGSAVRMFGSSQLDWGTLYKVHEYLVRSAGGTEAFRHRSGWSKPQLDGFRASANHPDFSGRDARHATRPDRPRGERISFERARRMIADAIMRWGTPPAPHDDSHPQA